MYPVVFVVIALMASSEAASGYHEPFMHAQLRLGSGSSLLERSKPIITQRTITTMEHRPLMSHTASHHVSVASIAQSAPFPGIPQPTGTQEHHDHPKYEFAYGVEDHHTGDIHSQKEVRDGDKVQGEYSLHEADGSIRIVKYTADKHHGFNATVTHIHPSKNSSPVKP